MMMFFEKVFLCICFLFLECGFSAAMDSYRTSWVEKPDIRVENLEFHKSIARRIAYAKSKYVLSNDDNIAGFGITVRAKKTGTDIFETFTVEFPKLFDSTYFVSEDNPSFETDGSQIIAVSDMFRGTPLSGETKKHNLCSFMLWIQSKPHAIGWDLRADLQSALQCIERGRANEMARISTSGVRFNFLHYLLHCEQLFLHSLLTKETTLNVLFSHLQDLGAFSTLLDGQHDNLEFFFEICTFNDMCQRCYESNYNLQTELGGKIGELLLKKFASSSVLSKHITKCFPINLKTRISSFRPFEDESRIFTRIGASIFDYATYCRAVATKPYMETKVLQMFNPWIAQHVLAFGFDDFIESVRQLSSSEPPRSAEKLVKSLGSLIASDSIEADVKNDMMTKFVSAEARFTRPDVCYATLPLVIELSKYITANQEQAFNFIRELAARSKIQTIDAITPLIEHLRTIPGSSPIIDAVIKDQQMLADTIALLQVSVPNRNGKAGKINDKLSLVDADSIFELADKKLFYDFNTMISIAKKINLTNVIPVIADSIKIEVRKIHGALYAERLKLGKLSLYNQLMPILETILR